MKVSMLLLAAGRGTRLGSSVPKAYVPCAGVPLVQRSLERLTQVTSDREILLAVHPEDRGNHLQPLLPILKALGLDRVVDGGASRQESMALALAAADPAAELVLIHDAARPFFPVAGARAAIEAASAHGAAVLAVPVPDTLKEVDARDRIVSTVPRAGLYAAQTPQVMRRSLLQRALAAAERDGFTATDDVSLVEHLGAEVVAVPGDILNFKVTNERDLQLAELLARREDEAR